MFNKNFVRGMVLGLIILAVTVPNISQKLQNDSANAALVRLGPPSARRAAGSASVANTITATIQIEEDRRVENLKSYLESKKSPLANSAKTFVEVADEYEMDYRFLPAVAGIESNFGRVQLDNSYNPFGWGGGLTYFNSFDEAIRTVGFELYERCIKVGADTPSEIGPSYCPPNYFRWIAAVEGFMEEITHKT
jgi:hypothetical protein